MSRKPGFDLAAELAKPSFTPGQRDAPGLVELIAAGEDPVAARAAAALARLGDGGRAAIEQRFDAVDAGARARLVAVLGLFARSGDAAARAALLARIGDSEVRVRRAAAVALGKLATIGGDASADQDVRTALLARWDADDVTADERRALAEALGKLGGDEAIARLATLATGDDAELARRRDRALLMAGRSAQRDEASQVTVDRPPPSPLVIRLGCRGGLAPLLVDELAAARMRGVAVNDATVQLDLAAPLATLFVARLWATLAIRARLEIGRDPNPEQLARAIVGAITGDPVRALLRAWTRGPIRWRLGFAKGHKRSIVWRVARDVSAAAPELLNDPTATTWDILVDDEARTLELVPRRLEDPRFAWRVAEIPAASHPTVAAALAWLAEARDDDRVWDPFCGAGAELVERARRGPVRSLLGTDLDDDALVAARANAAAAGVAIELARADARAHVPGAVDLIVTNPPLGSRVQLDAAALLVSALPGFARALAPRGRLVWITPSPRKTGPVAEQLGLRRVHSLAVDLGGVRGQLERWEWR